MPGTETTAPAAESPREDRAVPPAHRRHQLRTVVLVTAALALIPIRYGGDYDLSIANLTISYAIAAVGFYLVFGLSGQFAFSHAAFFGIGGYTFAWAARSHGFWVGLLTAVVVTALVALAFAWLVRRASHFYFAIATLGLSEIALIIFREWTSFTAVGGEVAVQDDPTLFGFRFESEFRMFWFLLGGLIATMVLVVLIERSPLRREAIAMRDHPEVAASLGVPIRRVRFVMFTLGSAVAGFAGALFASDQGFISPTSFGVGLGMNIFLMVILGGLTNMWGAVIGATFVVLLPERLRSFAEYRELIFALLLIATILALPEGITGLRQAWRRMRRHA